MTCLEQLVYKMTHDKQCPCLTVFNATVKPEKCGPCRDFYDNRVESVKSE